jgi:hypothetical protein
MRIIFVIVGAPGSVGPAGDRGFPGMFFFKWNDIF